MRKVGNDNTNQGKAVGKEKYGSMNNNGEKLLELCMAYDPVIGGTLFSQHEMHKLIWCPPPPHPQSGNGENRCRMFESEEELISAVTTILASSKLKLRKNGPGKASE